MDIIIVGLGSLFGMLLFWYGAFIPVARWIIYDSGGYWPAWYFLFLSVMMILCLAGLKSLN